MLVFLQIPRSTLGAYRAFRQALGEEAVGWVGRNLKESDLADPELHTRFKVIGGPFTLADVDHLPVVTSYATVVAHPVARTMGQFTEAIGDVDHPFHAAPHTFMLRELFEEKHPFAEAMSNVATRHLMERPDAPASVDAAIAAIEARRFIVGDGGNIKPFITMLARVLDVKPEALDEAAFSPPGAPPAKGELLRLIREANTEDIALFKHLKAQEGHRRVALRTKGERIVRRRKDGRKSRPKAADPA